MQQLPIELEPQASVMLQRGPAPAFGVLLAAAEQERESGAELEAGSQAVLIEARWALEEPLAGEKSTLPCALPL